MTPKEYLNKVESIVDTSNISESQINELIEDLLSVLPKGGKLYKYRSIDSEYYLDNLKYIFMAPVSKLNDKIDTTLNYRKINDDVEIDKFYLDNKYLVYKYYYSHHAKVKDSKRIKIIDYIIDGKNDFEIASLITDNKNNYLNELEFVKEVRNDVQRISYSSDVRNAFIREHVNLGERIRKSFRIFSLSEYFYQDSMWAYYCHDNRGYVVEYDFNKIRFLKSEEKKKFISTYKVIYSNEKPLFDTKSFYRLIFSDSKDPILKAHLNVAFNKQLLIKNKSWEHEAEWRISLADETERIYSDVISAIVIDESIINEERAIEIIRFATSRHWDIKIRVLNFELLQFEYKNIKETKYWKEIKKRIKTTIHNN